jgi:pyruvate kinase
MRIVEEGLLYPERDINLPGTVLDLPALTEKDESDIIDFGMKKGIDMIAISFVRRAEDVENVRDLLGPRGAHIKLIAKIENFEGLQNYEEILKSADGIMVARGDLGMDISFSKVFIAQKWMIELANLAAKPIITAYQMLDSMTVSAKPTRAESSDVANAVLDGTDVVLLSGETSDGKYPFKSVLTIAKLCAEAERCFSYKRNFN